MPLQAGSKVSTPLIREYDRWLRDSGGRAPRTADGYRDAVEFFAARWMAAGTLTGEKQVSALSTPNEDRWLAGVDPDWSTVTLRELERFVLQPIAATLADPSKSTRRKRVYALKAFFEFLVDHGELAVSPASRMKGPGIDIQRPKPIADADWLAIWDQPMSMEDRVLLGLGYYLGLRRHELIGVGPHHFDLDRRRVSNFKRKGGKLNDVLYGKNNDIIRRRLPALAVRLDEFEQNVADLVVLRSGEDRLLALTEHVGSDESNSDINRRLSALSKGRCRAHVTPHQLRHSFGTNLLRAGVPLVVVGDQMAHSKLETTRGYLDTEQWYDEQMDERY